jgi:TRAP-type C4-dicarboxylate transport system permease small subunit
LIFLAPFIAEVLSGATRVSFIFAFVPEMMMWGCGALIIRELVKRWNGGWTSVLLLALALAVFEECVVQQTSLAPLPWPAISANYGRVYGVNWIYFLYMLGYESVWVVVVPIQVTELIFPEWREERWLRTGGMLTSVVVFLLGACVAWYAWIKRARPMVFHAPYYDVPRSMIVVFLVVIAALILLAFLTRYVEREDATTRTAPPPWSMVAAAMLFGFPWYRLMVLIFGERSTQPFWVSMALGAMWGGFAYFFIRYWSVGRGWNDKHRWGLTFGAVLVCMIAGFSGSSTWPRVDLIGKSVLDVLAVIGFAVLARWIWGRRGFVVDRQT